MSIYCKCNLPDSPLLLRFSSQYSHDSEDFERGGKQGRHAGALLKMSFTIDILSAFYYVPNDDDT